MRLLCRPDVRYPLILAALSLLLWAPRLRGSIDLRYDAGVYYILGTSLAEGKGYRLLNEPGEINALQYPPLLPAVVALEQKMLGTSDPTVVGPWLRYTYFAIFILYSLAIYALARQALSAGYAFLAALICTVSCMLLFLSDLLQAELPFAFATVMFALSAGVLRGREVDGESSSNRSPVRFALASVFGVAAFLIRSAGIALLAAWVGEAVFRRKWKQAALRGVVAAVPFFAWQAWVTHVRSSAEYASPTYAYQRASYQYYNVSYLENLLLVDSFKPELGKASPRDLIRRVLANAALMPAAIADAVSLSKPFAYWAIDSVNTDLGGTQQNAAIVYKVADGLWLVFGLATLAGMVWMAALGRWFVPLYLAGTIFLICLTPWPKQFERYLSPAAPFLVLSLVCMLASLRAALSRIEFAPARRFGTAAVAAILVLIPLMTSIGSATVLSIRHSPPAPGETKLFYIAGDWISWSSAATWIKDHSRDGDVVATSAPHLLYLKTGRRAVLPPMEARSGDALRMFDSVPIRYLMVGSFRFLDIDARYVQPMLQAYPGAWRLVYTTPDDLTRVYERRTDRAAMEQPTAGR